MQTFALVMVGLALAVVAAAVLGRWWLRRAVARPVPAMAGGAPGSCVGCPQITLMAADSASTGGGAKSGGGAKKTPKGPDRRAFLRGALGLSAVGAVGGFGAASVAFLWPDVRGGFGAVLEVDTEDAILELIEEGNGSYEYSPGRAMFVRYDPAEDPDGQYAELTVDQSARVLALYQVCVHLGCSVPWCETSQWWECPCHGSQYNRWGEWVGGPAPRGLDRFRIEFADDGTVLLDTSEIVTGPARGANVLQQPPAGPNCI